MNIRAVASIALAAALGVGLAGCNYMSPQRTTTQYAASDGVNTTVGDLEIRNAVLIAEGAEGEATATSASLVFSLVNQSGEAGTLSISYEGADGGSKTPVTTTVPYTADRGVTPVGFGNGTSVVIEGAEFALGGTSAVTFTASTGQSQTIHIPVLNGDLAEYATLVPTTAPSAPATSAPAQTPAETEAANA